MANFCVYAVYSSVVVSCDVDCCGCDVGCNILRRRHSVRVACNHTRRDLLIVVRRSQKTYFFFYDVDDNQMSPTTEIDLDDGGVHIDCTGEEVFGFGLSPDSDVSRESLGTTLFYPSWRKPERG